MSRYRFPGLRSFEASEARLFKGREREKQALFDLIAVERCVVMFAKSGTGKTSLLQAGIVPMLNALPNLPFQPVFIRLNRVGQPLLQQLNVQIGQVFGVTPAAGQSLWEYLKSVNANSGDTTPVLFFDQFEEIFTLYESPEARREFIRQLAEVINGRLPASVEKTLDNLDALPDGATMLELEKPPRVKFVFSLRSDLLSFMHELSGDIPGILRNRFELKGLSEEGAADAIRLPAALQDAGFECPPFDIAPEALKDILGKLTERKQDYADAPEVESFQLQLVCNELEKKMLQAHRKGTTPLRVNISTYGGRKGIDDLLFRFYKETLETVPDKLQHKNARIIIEGTLIQNECRVSVAESTLLQPPVPVSPSMENKSSLLQVTLTSETLNWLVDKRLLRKEERPGLGNYYELVHDTLLGPVLRHKNERLIREAEENAEAEFKRTLYRILAITLVIGAVLVGALVLLYYVANLRNQAQYNYLVAESTVEVPKDRTVAFRIGEAAWEMMSDSTPAVGSMIESYYGGLLTLGATTYAAPHYREYDAVWAKPVPGSETILLLRPDHQTLFWVNSGGGQDNEFRPSGAPPIQDAVLSPDGSRLLTIHDQDMIARLWDVKTGSLLKPLEHNGALSSAAFSPDGQYITTNSYDESQRLWTKDGVFLKKYTNVARAEALAVFSPDSKQLLVGKDDQTVELHTLGYAIAPIVLHAPTGAIEQVHFSYPGQYITLVSAERERKTKTQLQVFNLQGDRIFDKVLTKNIILAATASSGTQTLVVSNDTISRINLSNRSETFLGDCFDQHRNGVVSAAFSPDDQMIASGGRDKIVKLWWQGKWVFDLMEQDRVTDLFFTADSRNLVTTTRADKVRIWGLKNNPVVHLNTEDIPTTAFFIPGTNEVLAQDFSGKLYAWDASGSPTVLPGWFQKWTVNASDGTSVLTPTEKGWKRINTQSGSSAAVDLPNVDPDGNYPVKASAAVGVMLREGRVKMFLEKDKTAWDIPLEGRAASKMGLSPDGKYLALLTVDFQTSTQRLEWWSVVEKKMMDSITFKDIIHDLVFSAGKDKVIFGSRGKVYVWGLKQNPVPFPAGEHDESANIKSLAVSRDGRFIASGGTDQKIVLWDVHGRHLHTFKVGYKTVLRLQFSDDGAYLLSLHHTRAMFVWPVAPGLLQEKLNAQEIRQLSEAERRVYKLE